MFGISRKAKNAQPAKTLVKVTWDTNSDEIRVGGVYVADLWSFKPWEQTFEKATEVLAAAGYQAQGEWQYLGYDVYGVRAEAI